MEARLSSTITFYQVLIKIKYWLAIVWVKVKMSLMMTIYNGKFLSFLWHSKQHGNLDCMLD